MRSHIQRRKERYAKADRDWIMTIYDTPKPKVLATSYGKYLALAPYGATFKIGVIGQTESDAARKFCESYGRWRSYFVPEPDYSI